MKNILKILLPLFAALLTTACAGHKAPQSSNCPITLEKDQIWQLTKMQGRDINRNTKSTNLSFNPEAGTLKGQTACNSYSANYSIGNSSDEKMFFQFATSNFQFSNVQCPEADMNAESRYLAILKKCTQISVTSTTLTLSNKDKPLLVFELQ